MGGILFFNFASCEPLSLNFNLQHEISSALFYWHMLARLLFLRQRGQTLKDKTRHLRSITSVCLFLIQFSAYSMYSLNNIFQTEILFYMNNTLSENDHRMQGNSIEYIGSRWRLDRKQVLRAIVTDLWRTVSNRS